MAQYLLSVWLVDGDEPPTQQIMEQMYADVDAFNTDLQAAGAWIFAGGLLPKESAVVVAADGSDVSVTEGVLVTGPESLGGFWIIEVGDDQAARQWAGLASQACRAPVEVRPFESIPDA
ncbi:MAG: YciI family protein [Actinomycetes bacterium]